MARPVGADAGATRAAVLEAATRLFSARGGGRTSVREIAREASVSLATVHHYFGSKDGLYEACIEAMYTQLEALRSELLPALIGAGSVEDVIERSVRLSFRFGRRHRAALRLLMRRVLDEGGLDADRRQRHLLPFLAEAAPLLAARLGRPEPQVRLLMQSLVDVTVRWAMREEDELALIAGVEEGEAAVAALEEHLGTLARVTIAGWKHETQAKEGRP